MLIKDKFETKSRHYREISDGSFSFEIEEYKTNCCGLFSFEAFQWDYDELLEREKVEKILCLAEQNIPARRGIIATVPIGAEDYWGPNETANWKILAAAFRARGFRCIKRFTNGNTGNVVQLFFKVTEN